MRLQYFLTVTETRFSVNISRALPFAGQRVQSFSTSLSRSNFKRYTMPLGSMASSGDQSGASSSKGRKTAYIALGSNLGDRIGWIEKACNEMDARGIRVKRTSSLWETEPMYVLDQDRFANGVCEVCYIPCPCLNTTNI